MKQYKTRAIELLEQNNKITEVIDKVTKEFNLTDSRLSIQRNIYNWINNKGLHSECEAVGIDASKVVAAGHQVVTLMLSHSSAKVEFNLLAMKDLTSCEVIDLSV